MGNKEEGLEWEDQEWTDRGLQRVVSSPDGWSAWCYSATEPRRGVRRKEKLQYNRLFNVMATHQLSRNQLPEGNRCQSDRKQPVNVELCGPKLLNQKQKFGFLMSYVDQLIESMTLTLHLENMR